MAVLIPHLNKLRLRLRQIFLAKFAKIKLSSGLFVQCHDDATDRLAHEAQSCVYQCVCGCVLWCVVGGWVGGWVAYVWFWNFPHVPLPHHCCQHGLHALSAPASHQIPTECNWYIRSKSRLTQTTSTFSNLFHAFILVIFGLITFTFFGNNICLVRLENMAWKSQASTGFIFALPNW